jgi:sulfur-carrier protein
VAVVWVPSLLQDITGAQPAVTVPGATLLEVIDNLERKYPGIKARLCDGQGLRRGIAVAIDTQLARFGLSEPVGEKSEVHFLPAISGG